MKQNDATFKWSAEVNNCTEDARSLTHDINDLAHKLDDLVHTIRDLGVVRFDDELEDYEVYEKARALWGTVSNGTGTIRRSIQSAANDIYDLRRAVEFYNH
jgi:hypothetical protein